jgi:hypothetical protein
MKSGQYTVNIEGTLEKAKNLSIGEGIRLLRETFNMPVDVCASLLLDLYEGKVTYKIENNTLVLNN